MRQRVLQPILFLLGALHATAAAPAQIAIVHVTIVDVRDGSAKPDMTVILSGNQISDLGSSSKLSVPKDIQVVDGRAKFLIPGLWDMHVHSGGNQRALGAMLDWGITGVRDMGGDPTDLLEARRHIANQDWKGPRLLVAGPRLMGPPAEASDDVWVLHSAEEASRAVDSLIRLRVDFIKVHDGLPRDAYLTIASLAKAKRLPFVGHVPASMTPAEVSELGQKSIEHFEFVPKSCLAALLAVDPGATVPAGCEPGSVDTLLQGFAKNGTWLDPTIQSFRYFAPAQWDAIFAGFARITRQIRRNNVSILAGTDWSPFLESKGALPGVCLHDELALLTGAGFSSAEVLRAATWNSAVFLGLTDSLGTIERGKIANLVLLEADPIQDIRNTRRIAAVFLEGRIVVNKSKR